MWVAAFGAGIVMVFVAIFKYRGNKIANLEVELEVEQTKSKVVAKVIKAEKEVAEFTANNRVAAAKAEARDYEDITEHFYNI